MMGLPRAFEAGGLTKKGTSTETGKLNKEFAAYSRMQQLIEKRADWGPGLMKKGVH